MSFASVLPVMVNVVSAVFALAVVTQLCRMSVALRNGNTRRLRWLALSILSILLMYCGMLLMPATPAVVFASVVGALKTALFVTLSLAGSKLSFLFHEAMKSMTEADRG